MLLHFDNKYFNLKIGQNKIEFLYNFFKNCVILATILMFKSVFLNTENSILFQTRTNDKES